MTWYALVRNNPVLPIICHCGCGTKLTNAEQQANRNVPIVIHWDKSKLPPEGGDYYHVEVQPTGKLR